MMSNTTDNTNDTTTGALNGAAHANGAPSETPQEAPKEAPKEGSKAARKAARREALRAEEALKAAAPTTEAPTTETAEGETEAASTTEAEPALEALAGETGETTPLVAAEPVAVATTPVEASTAQKVEAPKVEIPRAGLRLRMKVWTDPATHKRYLMPTAVLSDPRSGLMTAYAMSDEDTKVIKLTPAQWNALPFFFFQEDGPAPRASARPVDVIR